MSIVPKARPALEQTEVRKALVKAGVDITTPVLYGYRGYYLNSMGAVGKNDIGIYDDAIFLLTPTAFCSFNANTDPSRIKPRVASLTPGLWKYRLGIHGLSKPPERRYEALVQAAPVTVLRAGTPPTLDTGYFGINIHRGGYNTTSSEGCPTIYGPQWAAFIFLVKSELKRHGKTTLPYLLADK